MTVPTSTPTRRRLPFLQRNWNQGILGATSGAQPRSRSHGEGVNGIDGTHEGRPLKRVRLACDATPEVSERPSRNGFPRSPPPASRTLRINVLKLAHKGSESRVKQNRLFSNIEAPGHSPDQVFTTRASCKITILDTSPLSASKPPVVYCTSQDCTIRAFKSPISSASVARVHLDEPFSIPEKNLIVIREDNTRGLAQNYRLDVELFAGDSGEWPPLDVSIPTEQNSQGTKRWVLLAYLENLFERRRSTADVFLHQYTREALLGTGFVADIDARWSTGLDGRRTPPEEDGMASITVAHGDAAPAVRHDIVLTHEDTISIDDRNGSEMIDEFDGETTPNRALRTREKPVYNLKKLSDKAHGKGKKPQLRDDGCVTYMLPDDLVSLESYRCVACGQPHKSIKFLRAHLRMVHQEYKCELRSTNGVSQFRVTYNHERNSAPPEEFQFTQPAEGLNIDKIARGKGLGREDETAVVQRPVQPRPRLSAARKRCEKPKVLVPKTGQPMYDPVSRALLSPGTELVAPNADHSWRIQLHWDNIADYVDIPSPEREYINAWDAFSLPRGVSSEVYLPGMLIDYVREKAAWLVASGQRMEELLKHLSSLQLRGVLDQRTKEEVLGLLGDAMNERERTERELGGAEMMDEDEPEDWQAARRAENCVVCGQAAAGIVCILVCSNTSCKRHFHLSCISDDVKVDPLSGTWFCNDCAPETGVVQGPRSPATA